MFISSYTNIYFFVKNFIFSNVYISVNTIFECFCVFWLKKGLSIKYLRNRSRDGRWVWWEGGGGVGGV